MKARGLAEGARVHVFNPESGEMQHADILQSFSGGTET